MISFPITGYYTLVRSPLVRKSFFLVFDPFSSEFVFDVTGAFLRVIKTFSEPLRKLKKSNWKWSYCNICIRCFRKLQVFISITMIFDLFPSEFVFDIRYAVLRLIKTFSEPLKKLKNSNRKWSDCRICIRCIRKFSIFSSLTSILDLFP